MTPTKVLNRLVAALPSTVAPFMRTHARCVATTRIGIDTLARFGIEAGPLSIDLRVFNAAQWIRDGAPGGDAEMRARGGYQLSNVRDGAPSLPPTREHVGRSWDGHLVVHVPRCRCLLDLDMRQLARPEFAIELPDAMVIPWTGTVQECVSPTGVVVIYETRRDPLTGQPDREFEDARDWQRGADDLVAVLERTIRHHKPQGVSRP